MRAALLSLMLLLLTSCGFQFQGIVQLDPGLRQISLQVPDAYGQLARSLTQLLALAHVQVVNNADAPLVLHVLKDDAAQRLLSVSSTQQTRQYSLEVTIVYELTDNKGKLILPPQTIAEARSLTIQSDQILGASNEANLFYQQMRHSLARSIMIRLASPEVAKLINNNVPSSGGLTH